MHMQQGSEAITLTLSTLDSTATVL